jgi:1-deoxy-D-xylulose-5-phosphate reductoisomerase
MVGPRKIALLGATGSIGSSVLDVVREQGNDLRIVLASGHTRIAGLTKIAGDFDIPALFFTGIDDPIQPPIVRTQNPGRRVFFGENDLLAALRDMDYDIAVNAISGSAGLAASYEVLKRGKPLALANKESLVMAGHILMPLSRATGAKVIPVDSEHSALFQCLGDHPPAQVRKLHITASGGAFRELPLKDFPAITPHQALKHPNWDMGAKVTLDSATMMNKALEVMEAHWLFGVPYDRIEALIHPQSVIHSLVEFIDGSILAQMSVPDMRLPVLYALSWPHRFPSQLVRTDLLELGNLSFHPIDQDRYPLFYLGLEAARSGGLYPTVLNSANEAALKLFLEGRIGFTQIVDIVRQALDECPQASEPSMDDILRANRATFAAVLSSHSR